MCLEMDFKSRYSTQRTLAMQKLAFPMSHMPRIDLGWLCSLANSHIPELLREQLLKLHIPCDTSSQLKLLGGHIQRSGRPISHTKPADIAHQTPKRKEEVENKTIFRPS